MATGKKLYHYLYFYVLVGILLGILLGWLSPATGVAMKPLGDGFIKLIKMLIAPIIFATVVTGIANIGDMGRVGRVGIKALIYFEVVTTVALGIGLIVGNLYRPGAGLNIDPATLDSSAVKTYASSAQHLSTVDFLLNIIPTTLVDAFTRGDILQVLLIAILFGLALALAGPPARPLAALVEQLSHVLFGIVGMVMKLAPLGVFGAMAFTIGKYGLGSLASLARLMGAVYLTCLMFVFVILGAIAWIGGVRLWRLLVYIKEEIVLVLGTSSSESALPLLMRKLEDLGCSRPVVGLVVPTGYSFNLDGTSIYLTMAVLFISQATNRPLSLGQQLAILGVLMLTSKGAAAVTGGGFITLAATLSSVSDLPVAGLALLLGVDRFMSEARAITNLIGNTVATVVVARWEGELDMDRATAVLEGDASVEAVVPETA